MQGVERVEEHTMDEQHRELVDKIAMKYAVELRDDLHTQRGELNEMDFALLIAEAIQEALREVEKL